MADQKGTNEQKPKLFSPNFENGGYWDYYKDLERQFVSFLSFVPYIDKNENVCSFRLANLIFAIGAHIDSAFKEIIRYPTLASKYAELNKMIAEGKPRRPCITDYIVLNDDYDLSKKALFFKRLPEREELSPFKEYGKNASDEVTTPQWWKVYNNLKHNFSDNFEHATLKNARDALAGAFLLNVVHKPAVKRLLKYKIYKSKWLGTPDFALEEMLDKGNQIPPVSIQTPVFYFELDQEYDNPEYDTE